MKRYPILRWARENRFSFLVVSLLLLLLVSPFFLDRPSARAAITVTTLLVLASAAYAAADSRREAWISTALFLPALIGYLVSRSEEATPVGSLMLPFLVWVALDIYSHVRRASRVTAEILFGALGVYLLLGFIWSHLYEIVESIRPGSFSGVDGTPGEFLYFSFVTLTTLGYGDVLPLTPQARSLVVVEAVTGVIYMAVMIGGLVGLYISTPRDQEE